MNIESKILPNGLVPKVKLWCYSRGYLEVSWGGASLLISWPCCDYTGLMLLQPHARPLHHLMLNWQQPQTRIIVVRDAQAVSHNNIKIHSYMNHLSIQFTFQSFYLVQKTIQIDFLPFIKYVYKSWVSKITIKFVFK